MTEFSYVRSVGMLLCGLGIGIGGERGIALSICGASLILVVGV